MTLKALSLSLFSFVLVCSVAFSQVPQGIKSELVILNIETLEEKTVLLQERHFEAPNWSRDGSFLLINSAGKLEKVSLKNSGIESYMPEQISRVNNDHGISFDAKTIVFSKNDSAMGSRIYTVPFSGGKPKLITEKYPSYWHGISPDGSTLVYCAQRDGQWDIYSIASNGGQETRLTNAEGLDDGPEYSYDGNWIYFNSHRTGRMQAYRMRPNGDQQEQLTYDELDNWFPHPSPDNNSFVMISYLEDQKGAHPFGKDVKLRLKDLKTGDIRDLTPVFYGGQGTINVHSWSPDGKWIAFVRYHK